MNLHYFITFSSRGSGVCRSLFLRTFMVMILFITGSNGIYAGEDLKATIGTPASNGTWNPSTGTYKWTLGYDNLMPIFRITKGTLKTDYVALKFTTKNYAQDHPYRVCFMDGEALVATVPFYSEGEKTIKISELKVNEGKDLSQVDNIRFGGNTDSGSITLDPNSIVLVGQSKITVSPSEDNKGTVYFTVGNDTKQYTNATVPNHTKVKFYAKPNTEKVVFTGWKVADKVIYDNPAEVEVTGDLNFIARFPDGIHISCTVEPKGAAEPDVYQKGHLDWKLPVDGYVAPGQATTFGFKNQQGKYKFLGWYDANNNELSKETSYTVDNINAETKVIAKFNVDIQNNTQRYDLSKFVLTNQGNNVQSAEYKVYNEYEKALEVKTKEEWDNYFPLYKDLKGTKRTGVRLTAKGVKFRIIAKTSDNENNTFKVNVPESNGYVTRHYKWEDFVNQKTGAKMTEADVAKITQIGLAGDNAAGETNRVFYVQEFWLDDIVDYNQTIPCYGDEGGRWDWDKKTFVYTTAGATAVFEGSNNRDANHNIILNANKKVTLSSYVNKFTEVCLVFGAETKYNLTVAGTPYNGTGTAVICPVNSSKLIIQNNSSSAIYLSKIIYSSEKAGINEERTITVDGKTRKYWLYVPASVEGITNVPVVFSLHGRGNNDTPSDYGKPIFTSLANEKGFIVVYPQGRNGGSEQDRNDYPGDWYNGFAENTGWEATGKENADTKFIKALVDKIQSDYKTPTASNSNISVDPKKFYLCGFSMGGMMTYACAKVLNGTFAAYGSCGGFPLNEFHMSLATENPIPFIHLHGYDDKMLGIKHLNTIIENLLFRNGCSLKGQNKKEWTTTTVNGEQCTFKRYDFTSESEKVAPVTTVTFKDLGHSVHPSAPTFLWEFFSDKTVGQYDSDIEWKWDMTTINEEIAKSSSGDVNAFTYGWKHVINGTDRSLTYGGEGNTPCSIKDCTSANEHCNGNHNVYNSIQLTAGKHTLYAKMESTEGTSSVTLRNILTGAETVARKIVDNSGNQQATTYNVLYEFEVGEGAEFSLILKRSDVNSRCSLLEIHKGSYRPEGVTDQSQDNATINIEEGKLAELTFENGDNAVDIFPMPSANGAELTSENMKLYLKSRLGIQNGTIDKKEKYIVKDAVFGHYFQNIPDADIYDRYGASDYMRVVLGENNSLSGHKDKDGKDIDGIQKTGKVTIGFWVNGNLAVNRGLAYDEPSMFYIAGDTYNGPNKENNPHMFNITCNGGLSGNMNDGQFKYNTGTSSFGELCDTKSNADFYNKNFYKDCNWHYITYQMYDNLSRFNMYVDGEPTCLGGYATHNAGSLEEYINGLKSIVLGGANANNVEFGYDVAFAYDDIVIYNRVLSKREINTIIENKKYSPSVWHFDRNLENNIFFNSDLLENTNMWASSNGVYTLKTNFSSAAALTYDGITEIPAFKGLRFVTNGEQKIQIDANSGALHLSQDVKVVFSNLAKDTYVRMEYKKKENNVAWTYDDLQNVPVFGELPSPSQDCVRTYFKVGDATSGEPSITMPSDIKIIRMEATNKSFAQIKFVDNNNEEVSVVKNPSNEKSLPRMDLYVNAVERLHTEDDKVKLPTEPSFKYTSSSPHVASIAADGTVTLHGIAGSTVITAELNNDKNEYDCDIYDQYAFEPSNRIFSSYEIVVEPKDGTFYKVADSDTYTVGKTLYNGDKTVGVTLGGWTYNGGEYYGNTDSYTAKTFWEGQKFVKNADRSAYLDSRKTEEDVFHEFFNDKNNHGGYKTFSTNGNNAAKSEQLKEDYAGTGNYSAPAKNTSAANETPWLLPCRGSYIKIEPTDAGLISVYVMQEGCVSHAPSGGMNVDGVHYNEDEPIDVTVKKVYVADEKGEIVKEVVADTKSKVAAQMWKDDGRARAEYRWGDEKFAYNKATMESFLNIKDFNTQWSFLDNWPNPGMQQHVFKVGKDEDGKDKDGYVLITKGIVRYTFNVLPGKTYYIFSNTAKLGLAGFTFEKGKHAIYEEVMPDAKHYEWRATGEFETIPSAVDVTLNDGENYPEPAPTAKNANVKLNRTFYKNYWNAICLPYSINRRQIEDVFGDGTMVVLMNNINTSTKKVMFIEHANQDIIAGYPYLIFPTKKDDNYKTDHSVINNGIITTRATFGEADSPIFTVGTDGTTYADGTMQQNALVFKGTFSKEELPVGSYVITKSGTLANVSQTGLWINPYRAYIHFNQTTPGAKAIKLASMGFAGIDDMEGETTSIEDLLFNDGIMTRPADVFNVNGQKVRSKAENLYGLPKGVYIVNGKKYVNK